jgi:hypothetical protein
MKKVYLVIHKYPGGDQIEVFDTQEKSKDCFRAIMREYAEEYDISPDADNDSELYEASDGKVALCLDEKEVR